MNEAKRRLVEKLQMCMLIQLGITFTQEQYKYKKKDPAQTSRKQISVDLGLMITLQSDTIR